MNLATQELEELAQAIDDEAYQIVAFNEELARETANIKGDIRGVLAVLKTRRTAHPQRGGAVECQGSPADPGVISQ